MHILYFAAYAIYNYICAPFYFTWNGFSSREISTHQEGDQEWRVLEVTFPPEFHTHCPTQKYYFDDQHQLRRLDYHVPIVGEGNDVAHYCLDHGNFDGLVVPTLRRVLIIPDGIRSGGPSSVLMNISSVVVTDQETAVK